MPICFDLDGTLGHFSGGYLLLREALGELWGDIPTETELFACQGSTDWEIVDELHRNRFHTPLSDENYAAFESLCLSRFEATFHAEGRAPVAFEGILMGMARLLDEGHRVWLVSGNAPRVLTFKARALRVDARVFEMGSLPGCNRAALIRRTFNGCAGPHLYVGDRPHDREAAASISIPFLGIGDAVPGDHPQLSPQAEADHLVEAVQALLKA